jgi:hypothetical protein
MLMSFFGFKKGFVTIVSGPFNKEEEEDIKDIA